jgi:hypothetical protein
MTKPSQHAIVSERCHLPGGVTRAAVVIAGERIVEIVDPDTLPRELPRIDLYTFQIRRTRIRGRRTDRIARMGQRQSHRYTRTQR